MSKNYGNDSQIAEIVKYISDTMKFPVMGAGGGFAPIGTIIARMSSTAPQGFLLCDGTVYNISDYPDLATHFASDPEIGSVSFFGGNGTTTFAVPDLRGEFLRGSGTNSHTNQGDGANVGVHQDSSRIFAYGNGTNLAYITSSGINESAVTNYDNQYDSERDAIRTFSATAQSSNDNTSYAVRPTNTSVNFYIKATVSGDPNAHQYSTEEQVVGMTEDGEYIYEKTVILNSEITLTGTSWIEIDAIPKSSLNINKFLDCVLYDSVGTRWYLQSLRSDQTVLSIVPITKNIPVKKFIIQYTKTQ